MFFWLRAATNGRSDIEESYRLVRVGNTLYGTAELDTANRIGLPTSGRVLRSFVRAGITVTVMVTAVVMYWHDYRVGACHCTA